MYFWRTLRNTFFAHRAGIINLGPMEKIWHLYVKKERFGLL